MMYRKNSEKTEKALQIKSDNVGFLLIFNKIRQRLLLVGHLKKL